MKRFLILLLLFPIFHASGESVIRLDRTWIIGGEGDFSFDAAFAVNDSNQKLLNYSTSPEMQLVDDSGNLRLRYSGSEKELSATAFFLVQYDARIMQDPAIPHAPLNATSLTQYTKSISEAADLLSGNSSLAAIRNLTEFTYLYIEYDTAAYGKIRSAESVFEDPRGVCVEYSHLIISMLRYLGIDARYVSGYAYSQAWQPHAWVEAYLPGVGFISIDPTFNQAGALDPSHVAIGKAADHSLVFDSLEAKESLNFSSSARLEFISQKKETSSPEISYSFSRDSGNLDIHLQNSKGEYVFSNFGIMLPAEYKIDEYTLVLLGPMESRTLSYQLNATPFDPDYRYTIPFEAYIGGREISETLVIEPEGSGAGHAPGPAGCVLPAFVFFSLINLYLSRY